VPQLESTTHSCTRACADYVNNQTEQLTLFVTALELAAENGGPPAGVAGEITADGDPHGSFRSWFDRQMAETLLTRAVDGFLTYLADLLAMVYEANPNALPREANIPVSLALDLDNRDALVRELAGRRVRALSRNSIDALNLPFKALHFPLFRSKEERNAIERVIAQRDLLVNSRGIVDHTYLRRVPNSKTPAGEPLIQKRSQAVDDTVMLVEAAVRVDRIAAESWDFETVEIQMGPSRVQR
jgi:hypothetical protein